MAKATKKQVSASIQDGPHADLLLEMRERWEDATDQWDDIRTEGTTDMRYCAGDPWEPEDRLLREQAGRPVLSFDEFSQYVNQLINDIRQHKRSIKVTAVGYGANDEVAKFKQDHIRQIEYRSNAQQAYTSGFENTVQRGYGFWRVISRYVNTPGESGGQGGGFDQELIIDPLPNPDLVTIDPNIIKPDGADMKYAWVAESWPIKDYQRRWPKAKIQDFDSQLAKSAPAWMDRNRIQVAEYWNIESTYRTLQLFDVPGAQQQIEIFKDDLKLPEFEPFAALEPLKSRDVAVPTVKQYLTNGFEILGEPTTWPGKSIPIICCFGKIMYLDTGTGAERTMLSLVRLARDPAMLLSYYRTCEAELVGMTPKIPYMIREGALNADQMELLQKSLHEPVAVIQVSSGGDRFPAGFTPEMPQRQPYDPPIQPLEVGAESCRRAIQSAMGISSLPTSAQRNNEKSGKALNAIRDAEQQGSFHFIDSYENAITRTGAIIEESMDAFYDTARDVTVRTGEDKPQTVRINDAQRLADGQEGPIMLGQGKYDVTLSTGPNFDSEREAANDFADTLLQSPFANLIADLAVRLKNLGPVGDSIAERLHAMLPQQILQKEQGQKQSLESLQAQLAQAGSTVQQLQQALQEAHQIITTKQVEAAGDYKTEQLKQDTSLKETLAEIQSRERIAWIQASAAITQTTAKVDAENARTAVDALEERLGKALDLHLKKLETLHAVVSQSQDHLHEAALQADQHAHEGTMADQAQQHALDQAAIAPASEAGV